MFKNITRHLSFKNIKQINHYKSKIKQKAHAKRLSSSETTEQTTSEMQAIYDRRRCWQYASEMSPKKEKHFKIVSYNILAQDLLVEHMHLYYTIDPSLLRWNKRQENLQKEIQCLDPDILCLQEMQYDHLKSFVQALRGKRRLEYVFKKKTGYRTDGCAIIYDRDKFQLLAEQGVEYYMDSMSVLNRENIALLAKFKTRDENKKEFVVATTHLLYNPRRDDVRCAQIGVLHSALKCFAFKDDDQLPVIVTGDFNFESDSESYSILQQGVEIFTDEGDKVAQLQLNPLVFGCETASTFQNRWITVDYILYAQGNNGHKLKILGIYELPKVNILERRGLIPNHFLGSDHLCLAIIFSIK